MTRLIFVTSLLAVVAALPQGPVRPERPGRPEEPAVTATDAPEDDPSDSPSRTGIVFETPVVVVATPSGQTDIDLNLPIPKETASPSSSEDDDENAASNDDDVIAIGDDVVDDSDDVIKTAVTFTPLPTATTARTAITFTPLPSPAATPSEDEEEANKTKPDDKKKTKLPAPRPTNTTPLCVKQGGGTEVGDYFIDFDYVLKPEGFPRMGGYRLSSAWEEEHQVGTASTSLGMDWAEYGEFKCQYSCNAMAECVSFAGWQVQVGSTAGFECHLYDALIDDDVFTLVAFDSETYLLHGFNKYCSTSKVPKRALGGSGDSVADVIEKRGPVPEIIFSKAGSSGVRCREADTAAEVACPIHSNCAGLGLMDARPDEAWKRYFLTSDWVLRYRWAGFVQEGDFSEARFADIERRCKLACLRNLSKCNSFAVSYGPRLDSSSSIPDFILAEKPANGFTCSIFTRTIDPASYQPSLNDAPSMQFKGVNVECTRPF